MANTELIGNTTFTFKMVDSKELLEEAYRLRFQVYCKECGFIKEEDYPQGMEYDDFDPYSLHFAAMDSYGVIGTVRLITSSPLGFPLELHCDGNLTIDINNLPRQNLAEISRLVISKAYRKRVGDGLYYAIEPSDDRNTQVDVGIRRRRQIMAFGLYRELYQESKRRGITHWYALMEKVLWRLLDSSGFSFEEIGKPIDYFGTVIPYLGIIEKIERNVLKEKSHYYEYFSRGFESEYLPESYIS